MVAIMSDAKKMGSLRDAVEAHMESGVLAHSTITPIPMDGMTGPSSETASQAYGIRDMDMLFPEFHNLNNPPEWIKRDTDWVSKVMNGVHHTPFSRIKSTYANITEDDARALGYIKGNQKKEEVFTLLKRTTTPQTIYKKQKFDKDDLTDITDFDVVAWVKAEMRIMLDEEIARAILIGDGRAADSDDHIKHEHIRPIATDVDLFNIKVNVTVPGDATPGVIAKKFIDDVIRARKYYKGSGNPKMFTTADMLTEMLLLEDNIGHKLYKSVGELATTLRVSEIVEVEVMEGQKINGKDLAAIIVNLNDYNVGADKGGAVSLFDDFDIDYNQYKYLIETRCSGALIKPFSAMTVCIATANA
jgi:HK97 family phage major capsid protein